MAAGTLDLIIEEGASWERTIWLTEGGSAIDLTDFSATMTIRESLEGPVVKQISTTEGGITISGSEGKIVLSLTDSETAALGIRRGVYDLFLDNGAGQVVKLLKGNVEVDPAVTR